MKVQLVSSSNDLKLSHSPLGVHNRTTNGCRLRALLLLWRFHERSPVVDTSPIAVFDLFDNSSWFDQF